jgi:hypothetical protein
MESQLVVALVVLVAGAAHVALYRWIKFKIHEGVILQFLRDAEAIAAHTRISTKRVAAVCRKSTEIAPDSQVKDSWRAE